MLPSRYVRTYQVDPLEGFCLTKPIRYPYQVDPLHMRSSPINTGLSGDCEIFKILYIYNQVIEILFRNIAIRAKNVVLNFVDMNRLIIRLFAVGMLERLKYANFAIVCNCLIHCELAVSCFGALRNARQNPSSYGLKAKGLCDKVIGFSG